MNAALVQTRSDLLSAMQALKEAHAALCDERIREATIKLDIALAALGEARKQLPIYIPSR